jgi:hypothetical protein
MYLAISSSLQRYAAELSTKLIPRSSARFSSRPTSSPSSGRVQPISHAPKPSSDTRSPVRPSVRYCIAYPSCVKGG